MNEDFPKNELDFDRCFSHEAACLDYLLQLRWPDDFVCPDCGHTEFWKSARDLYVCRHCQKQHSITSGTLFYGTKKPLRVWFKTLSLAAEFFIRRTSRSVGKKFWRIMQQEAQAAPVTNSQLKHFKM